MNTLLENKKNIIIGVVVILAICTAFLFGKKSAVAPEINTVGVVAPIEATTTIPLVNKGTPSVSGGSNTKTITSAPVTMKNGAYVVYYTSHGFSPATITIKKGKSVHFVNSSNKAMSITALDSGSQVYGELNQSKTVGNGGVYDFMFLTAGDWTYINRNNPRDKGLIIVQ